MTSPTPNPASPRALFVAGAVIIGSAFSTISSPLIRPLLDFEPVNGVPYLRSAIVSGADLIVLCTLLCLAARATPTALVRTAGLAAPVWRPFAWTALWLAPALAVCFWAAQLSTEFAAADVLWLAVGAPVVEEIGFRGLAVGALMRLAGWRFLPAALLPALLFGLAHFANGEGPAEIGGIVAITALGGLTFGWLFVRWGFNLWPAILLHAGLNALWLVFALGDNAIGGWFGNALRLGIVIVAIAATFWLAPKQATAP